MTMEQSAKVSTEVSPLSKSHSKAQMCLYKIITIIKTNSSATVSHEMNLESQAKFNEKQGDNGLSCGKRGLGLDLNLRLGSCLEENGVISACSGVGADEDDDCIILENWNPLGSTVHKSCEVEGEVVGECDLNSGSGSGSGERQPLLSHSHINTVVGESSDITHLEEDEIKAGKRRHKEEEIAEDGQSKPLKNQGYLDLLVEAARLMSAGSIEANDENNIKKAKKKKKTPIQIGQSSVAEENEKWVFEDDISPIVRSRRGRTQVLPSKLRGSIIEPFKKETPKKQRSSSRVSSAKSRKKKD